VIFGYVQIRHGDYRSGQRKNPENTEKPRGTYTPLILILSNCKKDGLRSDVTQASQRPLEPFNIMGNRKGARDVNVNVTTRLD